MLGGYKYMIEILTNIINNQKNRSFNTLEMEKEIRSILYRQSRTLDYREFANAINELQDGGKIKPILASKKNTMYPPLYKKYSKVKEIVSGVTVLELLTNFHPRMNLAYFKERKKEYVLQNMYLTEISEFLYKPDNDILTVNERSLELFDDEKFLDSNVGKKLLLNIGITIENLMCEKTYEPFFYYQYRGQEIENILIIENKDTFYSVKKLMAEGINNWGETSFQLLIYGEGNKITRSIEFINELDIPENAKIYYYGDIDREGISIKHRLHGKINMKIEWMKFFYIESWNLRRDIKAKKKQTWNEESILSFIDIFPQQERENVYTFLKNEYFVPQETLNRSVLRRLSTGV
jgi:hypothetical protein